MSAKNQSPQENVKAGTTGIIVGLLMGWIMPPITWIVAYFLYKSFLKDGNLSDAKGIKIGALITGGLCCVVGLVIIPLLAAILVPNFVRAKAQGQLTACKSNLKNLGTACEMYSTDHYGRYPQKLSELCEGPNGGYLKTIPTCPAAGTDSYVYTMHADPDIFTIYCRGENHTVLDVPKDKPAYSSIYGLIEQND